MNTVDGHSENRGTRHLDSWPVFIRRRGMIIGPVTAAIVLAGIWFTFTMGPGSLLGLRDSDADTNTGEITPGGQVVNAQKRVSAAYPLYGCRGYSSLPRDNPKAAVLRDEFAWGKYTAVRVGDGRGNINWKANPHKKVSWQMWFNSLRWIGSAVDPTDDVALNHAVAIAKDWVKDNPYSWKANPVALEPTMHRTNTLLCLRQALAVRAGGDLPADQAWIDAALRDHGRFLVENYSGRGNHGTDESIALLGVGCNLRLPAFIDAASTRLGRGLAMSLDAQGSTDEQSPSYAFFNRSLWTQAAARLALCAPKAPVTATIQKRLPLLDTWLAHASTPLGPFHQIGATQWVRETAPAGSPQEYPSTLGEKGTPPKERVQIYNAGYVFGRTGWGSSPTSFGNQSAYALRFGPPRMLHGHADHTAITWQARGRQILRDTGYGEYTRDAWEAFVKSPQAHNQLVISGKELNPQTKLTGSDTSRAAGRGIADRFSFTDIPVAGATRNRDIIVLSKPDLVVVVDRAKASSRRTFTQYWHLPPGQKVQANRPGTQITATGAGTKTTLMRLPYGAQKKVVGSGKVIVGAKSPINGWYWPTIFTRTPAPTVAFATTGQQTIMVTAIAASGEKEVMTATVSRSGSATIYSFDVGGVKAKVGVNAAGTPWRVS